MILLPERSPQPLGYSESWQPDRELVRPTVTSIAAEESVELMVCTTPALGPVASIKKETGEVIAKLPAGAHCVSSARWTLCKGGPNPPTVRAGSTATNGAETKEWSPTVYPFRLLTILIPAKELFR